MRKANFPSGTGFWLLVGTVILAAVLLTSSVSKRRTRANTFFCDQCGCQLRVTSDSLLNVPGQIREQRKIERTDLSNWYEAHFGTNCTHTWLTNHLSSATYLALGEIRLWELVGSSGSFSTPSITHFSADDQARVEELFSKSPDMCKKFISDELQMKERVDSTN